MVKKKQGKKTPSLKKRLPIALPPQREIDKLLKKVKPRSKTEKELAGEAEISLWEKPPVGMYIRDYIRRNGPSAASEIHLEYKKEVLEEGGRKCRAPRLHPATYLSFVTYCSKLALMGMIERREQRRSTNPRSPEGLDHPMVTPYVLTAKGENAPDEVWSRPLIIYYRPSPVDATRFPDYVKKGGTYRPTTPARQRMPKKEPTEVKPKGPKIVKGEEKPTQPKIYPSTPTLEKVLLQLADLSGEKRTPKVVLDLVTPFATHFDLTGVRNAVIVFSRTPADNPKGRDTSWRNVLDEVRKLADLEISQKQGKSPTPKKATPSAEETPLEKATLKVWKKWEESEKRNSVQAEKDITLLEDLFEGSMELPNAREALEEYQDYTPEPGLSREDKADEKTSLWEEFVGALEAVYEEAKERAQEESQGE
ncbi:MAG: hypothetical protein WC291_11770 [Thermodesulfovibrionales bacterium]|jgi:hypothetical protein